jgi:dienelactone hydrolase
MRGLYGDSELSTVVSLMNSGDARHQPSRGRRLLMWATVVVPVLLLTFAGAFAFWATSTPDVGPRALAALESTDSVQVIDEDGYTFQPSDAPRVGFILYPGGRVGPASYAFPAHRIAEQGYLVVVPKLTLNLAVFDADAADEVIEAHPEIEQWVLGGHSLGGTMAAQYAAEHRDTVAGLVLWAAYPAGGTDLSGSALPVASIFGTRDGLTTLEDIDASRSLLPAGASYVAIEGGNHAQFGDYGSQARDNPATISRDTQQAAVVEATLDVLRRVD